jgi:hypothetical protein
MTIPRADGLAHLAQLDHRPAPFGRSTGFRPVRARETGSPEGLLIKNLASQPIAFPNGLSPSDTGVPLGIVYFFLTRHGIARLSQAGRDGEGGDFSLLPTIALSY